MTNEDQILAALEEIASQIGEIKKSTTNPEKDLANVSEKIGSIEELLHKEKQLSQTFSSDIKTLKDYLNNIQQYFLVKQKEVIHNYIEVKKPYYWITGFITYFILSMLGLFLLVNTISNLKVQLRSSQLNDIKYRYLKIWNEPMSSLKKIANNSTELIYVIDSYYNSDPEGFENYVLQREEQIKQALEASEIAKQKEAEARVASEKAMKLNSVIE